MKQSVNVQNQKWFDKQMRLDRWRMIRLWYLQHCQQTFLRWLESNGMVQVHLTFMAEEADQLFIKEMGEAYEQSYHFGKHVEGAAAFLQTFSQTYHAACSAAEQQVLFSPPLLRRGVEA